MHALNGGRGTSEYCLFVPLPRPYGCVSRATRFSTRKLPTDRCPRRPPILHVIEFYRLCSRQHCAYALCAEDYIAKRLVPLRKTTLFGSNLHNNRVTLSCNCRTVYRGASGDVTPPGRRRSHPDDRGHRRKTHALALPQCTLWAVTSSCGIFFFLHPPSDIDVPDPRCIRSIYIMKRTVIYVQWTHIIVQMYFLRIDLIDVTGGLRCTWFWCMRFNVQVFLPKTCISTH